MYHHHYILRNHHIHLHNHHPNHKHHQFPYVQDYLREYGTKKVEANALIANPTAARALMREEFWQWLSPAGHNQWIKENKAASAEASGHVDAFNDPLIDNKDYERFKKNFIENRKYLKKHMPNMIDQSNFLVDKMAEFKKGSK